MTVLRSTQHGIYPRRERRGELRVPMSFIGIAIVAARATGRYIGSLGHYARL